MTRKHLLQSLHRKHLRPTLETAVLLGVFFGLMSVSLAAWDAGFWPVTLVCWLLQAYFGHAILLAFHEASHFVLHPNHRMNEAQGLAIGTLILTPLSAYRWVHNQHHTHLGTERDTELWPFVDPTTPRGWRWASAAGELLVGFFYTPVVFLRGVLVANQMPRHTRRRLVVEYTLVVAFWTATLPAVGFFRVWEQFLVGYLVPSLVAGNLQSLRKFTEHLGLVGHDVPSTTRTVIDPTVFGRVVSATMLHIDLHGPHHLYGKIPHARLPEATALVYEQELLDPATANVFPSYPAAIWAMLKTLSNPRVGSQWLRSAEVPQEAAGGGEKPLAVVR